ncbi:EXS family [Rhizoctonia solani]|uniref:EXS family n=1 Tax=Rhizoctonia solani TaxID=456999 RepID=A0A8H7M8X0_9AGAM|nr:EXS family [Rhizoctonia solani]
MKFARYLEETQIPEWKRAYLDYQLLKCKLSTIKHYYEANPPTQEAPSVVSKTPIRVMGSAASILRSSPANAFRNTTPKNLLDPEEYAPLATSDLSPIPSRADTPADKRKSIPLNASSQDSLQDLELPPPMKYLEPQPEEDLIDKEERGSATGADLGRRKSLPTRAFAGNIRATPKTPRISLSGFRRFTLTRQRRDTLHSARLPSTIDDILSSLNPVELEFFGTLHQEVEKVDKFYKDREKEAESNDGAWPGVLSVFGTISAPRRPKATTAHVDRAAHDPDAYRRAKGKLKRAILEFYRPGVLAELPTLKKFDKITKMGVQEQYTRERIEGRDFTSGETCDRLLKEVEKIYASQFAQGDEKKARGRLRASPRTSTHHYSTFRSGTWIGLSIPALGMALYRLLQTEVREQVPEWHSLLQVYAALSLPVIFVLLVGLNLVAWARARINFVFIFGLDVRTVIDAREYVELPSFLFATLAYAFCISFTMTGSEIISPTKWPIVWVGLALVTIFNPLPIFHRSARAWFLRTFGMLFLSGTRRVEFADFWLGDQLCSLVYTMSNLCKFDPTGASALRRAANWSNTGPYHSFYQPFRSLFDSYNAFVVILIPSTDTILSMLPNMLQVSYTMLPIISGDTMTWSMISIWQFILFATISSVFGAYWDYTMDWSVLKVQGVKYKFLRKELAYPGWIPVYYIAIIANTLIRFSWVGYIPRGGPPITTRSFIIAVFEMIRRVQWNFFRLENEHIGNADQFRVTREIPLPYAFPCEAESDDEEGSPRSSRQSQRSKEGGVDLEK